MAFKDGILYKAYQSLKDYRLGKPQSQGGMQFFEMQNPPGWGYQSYLQAYGQIGTLYAVVNVIAQAVAKVPWHLYDISNPEDREEITKHDLVDFLNTINPFQSRYQFMYLGTMYKLLVGEEFWQLNFNSKPGPKSIEVCDKQGKVIRIQGQPGEAWLAPPAFMSVIPSSDKYIDHYEFKRTAQDQAIPFSLQEIIHIKTPNPYNEYRGLSPAQALTVDLDSERYAARYQQKLFFNDATPGFVLEYPPENMPSKEARTELMQEWEERYKGFRNRGKVAFLWGAKANVLTMSNKDMDFALLRKFNRDAIFTAYHVPPAIMGITEHINRSNSEASQYDFAMYCVHPELCELRESLNKELCPLFGDNLYLDFENPVPEDFNAQTVNAKTLYMAGVINKNEARQMVDFDPLDGDEGEQFYQPPASPFGGGDQSHEPAPPSTPEPPNPSKGVAGDPKALLKTKRHSGSPTLLELSDTKRRSLKG